MSEALPVHEKMSIIQYGECLSKRPRALLLLAGYNSPNVSYSEDINKDVTPYCIVGMQKRRFLRSVCLL